jgi:hypothetical protein
MISLYGFGPLAGLTGAVDFLRVESGAGTGFFFCCALIEADATSSKHVMARHLMCIRVVFGIRDEITDNNKIILFFK